MLLVAPRHRAALVGLAAALAVSLSGCAGAAPASDVATGSAVPTPPSTPSESATSIATEAQGQRIEVQVARGEASGDTGRVQVALGTAVTLVVTTDAADELHVHGYDEEAELEPGTPAELSFDATLPGVFEVELHRAGTVLLTLQVS